MSIWADFIHQASYDGVEFDCLTARDSISRALVRRSFPRRNGEQHQDMGRNRRETRCQILFFERKPIEGEDHGFSSQNHLDRLRAFVAVLDESGVHDFVHPITGTYRARVEEVEIDFDAEEEDQAFVSCLFVEDTLDAPTFDPGAGSIFDAGLAAVRAQAAALDDELLDAGLDSDIGADAVSLADSWEGDPTLSLREVNLQLASMSSAIDEAMDTFELVTNPLNHRVWRAMQTLLWKLRLSADSFRQTQPQLMTITTVRDLPLRRIVVEHYGARDCERRRDELMRLNDIDDPSLIPAGSSLRAPVPEGRA